MPISGRCCRPLVPSALTMVRPTACVPLPGRLVHFERAVPLQHCQYNESQFVPGDQADGKKAGRKPDQKKKKSRPKPEAEGKEEDDESGYRWRTSLSPSQSVLSDTEKEKMRSFWQSIW